MDLCPVISYSDFLQWWVTIFCLYIIDLSVILDVEDIVLCLASLVPCNGCLGPVDWART